MRISAFTANNFLSHKTVGFGIAAEHNLTVIAGKNGEGKSAIAQGIMLAIFGTPVRGLTRKNELGELRTLGQSKGVVSVDTDEGQFNMLLSNGKHDVPPVAPHPLLPYTLDPELFFEIRDEQERRAVILKATGTRVSKERIRADLIAGGHRDTLVDSIDFSMGFTAAEDFAKKEVSNATARWRYITEETYGSQKALTWKAPEPVQDPNAPDEDVAAQALSDLRANMERAVAYRATLRANAQTHASAAASKKLIDSEATVREEMTAWSEALAGYKAEFAEVDVVATSPGGVVSPCPCCNERLLIGKAGELTKYVEPKGSRPRAAVRRRELIPLIETAEAKVRELFDTLTRIDAAKNVVTDLPVNPTKTELDQAEEEVASLHPKIAAAEIALRAAEGFQGKLEAAQKRTQQAAEAHADAVAYTELVEAIRELPKRYTDEALAKINAAMDELRENAFPETCPVIRLAADMVPEFGPVRYRMASKSQQWLMRLALAYAIAVVSGTGLLMADEFDILNPDDRTDILTFFEEETRVQTILIGTLKSPKSYKPEQGGNAVWIGAVA